MEAIRTALCDESCTRPPGGSPPAFRWFLRLSLAPSPTSASHFAPSSLLSLLRCILIFGGSRILIERRSPASPAQCVQPEQLEVALLWRAKIFVLGGLQSPLALISTRP